jgi:small-conductance mechanosensitive channel
MESLNDFKEALDKLMNYPLAQFGESSITLSWIVTLLLLFAAVVLAEVLIRRYLIMRVLARTKLERALQYAIGKILGYLILVLGFYVTLQAVGIDLSSLAIIAGAVGVGLGFGLQNIINNFVSGLIVLAERPIAIGDRIEVGGVAGQVQKISLRSTTVVTNDNISIIVPNGDFISSPVTNWSHGDAKVRFRLPFGVAYGSDIEKLRRIMLEVAAAHPKALKEPAPDLFFSGFGDSSLDFELVVWSDEMTFKPRRFKSELYYAIEKALRDNAIEIPFPQRDLHLRSGPWNKVGAQEDSASR